MDINLHMGLVGKYGVEFKASAHGLEQSKVVCLEFRYVHPAPITDDKIVFFINLDKEAEVLSEIENALQQARDAFDLLRARELAKESEAVVLDALNELNALLSKDQRDGDLES
jgi:hypothetical protein